MGFPSSLCRDGMDETWTFSSRVEPEPYSFDVTYIRIKNAKVTEISGEM
jgi:hypothetical protein